MMPRRCIWALAALLLMVGTLPLPAKPALSSSGNPRILVILVEFQDLTFTVPDPAGSFSRMLNQEGYEEFGGTGSVQDYYRENSGGLFVPSFDVVGPVRLNGKVADYGRDVVVAGVRQGDVAPELALVQACSRLDAQVDFSKYDANRDGTVDFILYYFPSWDQAAGAPTDRLWSQMGDVRNSQDPGVTSLRFDKKRLGPFACTSELRGYYGDTFCGIGLTCHELGHALGLPDLYDTDGALGGHVGGPWQYSPMGRGCYNNDGRTPPYFSAQELLLLGWMNENQLQPLPDKGPVEIGPLQEYNAFRSNTATAGEYYLYECRGGQGWDAPLAGGLVIYHVDRSSAHIGEWSGNSLNGKLDHPCFYAVSSWDPSLLQYSIAMQPGQVVFPGMGSVHAFEPVDWAGGYTGVQITNIDWTPGQAAFFYVEKGNGSNINGIVRDSRGNALSGVRVEMDGRQKGETDADGYFKVSVPEGEMPAFVNLTLSREGFRTQDSRLVTRGEHMCSFPQVMWREGEPATQEVSLYDPSMLMGYFPREGICAVKYPAADLSPYVGRLLRTVALYPCVQEGFHGDVYLTVDIGQRRVLTRSLFNIPPGQYQRVTVDIADAGIRILEGQDLYVGYGAVNAGSKFRVGTAYPAREGSGFFSSYDPLISRWENLYQDEAGYWMDVLLSIGLEEQAGREKVEDLGYNYIDPGSGVYRAGDRFPLQLVISSVNAPLILRWFYDGEVVVSGEVELTAGRHRVSAQLEYGNGLTERLQLELNVAD